ncbi:MAG TPA: ISL3 family transposase, partial [Acidimicrobiales bacterium]|nr:ISL3 family transposase [Acidimicrobiales bacterium]
MSLQPRSTFVVTDPSEIVQALVGLKDVRVLHYKRSGPSVELMIEQVIGVVRCPTCDGEAQVKERPVVHYVDLPVYGTPMSLAWKKHRMRCVNPRCTKKTWVLSDYRIAAKSCLLTTRAAKWATVQVGTGRTVSEVAGELDCDWHTINDAVSTYGLALLEADRKRLNQTTAIGLDETSFVKLGTYAHPNFATTVADVENHQIIDILPSREYTQVAAWIDKQPTAWKERIAFGALDMSATYAAVYSVILPKAAQVVDPFHAIALANRCLDAIRRRVQTEQLGHRGRKDDPLYRARRVLLMGEEKLDEKGTQRLSSLLALGDPGGEVAIAYRIKERLRDFYRTGNADDARQLLTELRDHCIKRAMPPEVRKLGRTIDQWFDKLCNFHVARVSNGPTEGLNNLIKRIKRIGFGFRNFKNYRIRA